MGKIYSVGCRKREVQCGAPWLWISPLSLMEAALPSLDVLHCYVADYQHL